MPRAPAVGERVVVGARHVERRVRVAAAASGGSGAAGSARTRRRSPGTGARSRTAGRGTSPRRSSAAGPRAGSRTCRLPAGCPPLPNPTWSRPLREDVERGAMRSATFTGWFIFGGRQMTPWPTWMRLVRPATNARNVSGDAHVRVLLEAGVLDRPDHVEADLVGEHRLLDDLVEDRASPSRDGVRGLRLVDQRELHRSSTPWWRRGAHRGRVAGSKPTARYF